MAHCITEKWKYKNKGRYAKIVTGHGVWKPPMYNELSALSHRARSWLQQPLLFELSVKPPVCTVCLPKCCLWCFHEETAQHVSISKELSNVSSHGGEKLQTPGSSFQLTLFSLALQRVSASEKSAEKKQLDSCSAEFGPRGHLTMRVKKLWNSYEVQFCIHISSEISLLICFYVTKKLTVILI